MTNRRNLENYLQVDYELAGIAPEKIEVRLRSRIIQIPSNLYHLPIPGEIGIHHFRLEIYAEERWLEEEDDWCDESIPLRFHLSSYATPTLEDFSEHIYRECSAALFALHDPTRSVKHRFYWCSREGIELGDVFVYLKLLHKNYENTKDFIRDYSFWHDSLYQTQKWFHYLLGDHRSPWSRWQYPVGEKLLEFISPEMYPREQVAAIREGLKHQK